MSLKVTEEELTELQTKLSCGHTFTITLPVRPKRNKYGAVKKEIDGYTFDSTGEARRYQELRLLEKAGKIQNLQVHVPHPLYVLDIIVAVLIIDFVYEEGKVKVPEDFKGILTPVFKLKRRMFQAYYGTKIRITKRRR